MKKDAQIREIKIEIYGVTNTYREIILYMIN